jgi:hypothetical protein
MTVEYAGFTLNPTLGLARSANTQGNGHGAGTCH